MNIITVVRYKLKSGFEDEFIKAINTYNYSNSILMRLVSIGNNEYLSIMEYDEIDKTGDHEIQALNGWIALIMCWNSSAIWMIKSGEASSKYYYNNKRAYYI